ncbi:MAG: hypothetical protein WCV99_11170 [Sterolibacterium sp.]|jgi:hypothetical protein
MNTTLRLLGAICAIVAMILSLIMAAMAIHEQIVRYELRPDTAGTFTDQLCQKIPGCLKLTVEPTSDWMNGTMVITFHVGIAAGGAKKEEIQNTLNEATAAQTGLLGWALHSSRSKLDVTTAPIPRRPK